jgi:L-fuconolactonase
VTWRIDAHQHFWLFDPRRDSWITAAMAALKRDFLPHDLFPLLKHSGVDGSVAVQTDQSELETLFLLELASRHEEIKGVVGWVDLCSPDVSERLQYFRQFGKLCGFRHIVQSEPDDRFLLRADFCRGIQALGEYDFAYDILIYPRQLPAALELVAAFPHQKFVIDHMAKPLIRKGELEPWSHHMRQLAQSRNVYCKVSGLLTEANWHQWQASDFVPYLDVVFDAFGANRLLLGSDWPVCLLSGSYQDTQSIIENYARQLSGAERNAIFGLNAIQFYGLTVPHHEPAANK